MKRTKLAFHPNCFRYANGIIGYRKGKLEFSLKTEDEREAIEKLKFELQRLDGTGVLAKQIRVKNAVSEYLKIKEKEHLGEIKGRRQIRAGTLKEIRYLFDWTDPKLNIPPKPRHLLKFFGNLKLSDINEVRWARYCERATVSDLMNHRKAFGQFLKWCKRRGYIKALPDITDIPAHKRRRRRVLNPNEVLTLISNAEGRMLLLISMGLFMGMRIGEIVGLSWDRIDLINKSLLLRDEDVKTDIEREVPVNQFVLQLLTKELAQQQINGIKSRWVFYNQLDFSKHTHKTTFGKPWATLVERCGFVKGYVTPHDLRATYEKYSNKSKEHTDTQREKMVGASIDVQRKTYVTLQAEDLRGLEEIVQIEGLAKLLESKVQGSGETRGESA